MFLTRIPVWSTVAWCLYVWAGLGMSDPHPSSLQSLEKHEPYFNPGKPNSVIMRETFKRNEPGSFGIDFHPRDVSIMGQAVAGILTQALYEAYERDGLAPEKERPSYDFPYVENGVVPPAFSVGIRMRAAGNQTGDFVLTNRRVVYVLSLMGFSLAHEKDLSNLKEYTFDVVVNQGDNPQVIIARGSLTNNDSPQPSRTSVQRS